MPNRRDLLGGAAGAASAILAGAFVINDPVKLFLPEREDIVLATELPPDPLGFVNFYWSEVIVDPQTSYMDSYHGDKRIIVPNPSVNLTIRGMAYETDVLRSQDFFHASKDGTPLRIYFTRGSK